MIYLGLIYSSALLSFRKPDLVVGAPFYADDKGHGGAAYVYLNDNHKSGNTSHKGFQNSNSFVRLVGPAFSRFGLSLASLGDLNKDGFDDLAIGAPYDGLGAVYVYLGSNEGIIREPSQVGHIRLDICSLFVGEFCTCFHQNSTPTPCMHGAYVLDHRDNAPRYCI